MILLFTLFCRCCWQATSAGLSDFPMKEILAEQLWAVSAKYSAWGRIDAVISLPPPCKKLSMKSPAVRMDPRATKVRGDLGFAYLFIIGSHADKGCRPNRGRWCAWEKVMWKIFDLCGLCGLGGGFVGLCWRAQVIHQSASTPRSAWLHSQSATMYIVFEMPLHLLWKRPHNSFLKFSWSNFRFPGAAGMTSVKNVLRIWIKIGVRIINSWPTIQHLTLHILEAWFWILWVLTHFDHFWSIFPIQKTISARPSLWRARCWTSRPPAVRHRSRWSCWVGAAWPPPGPHRPRWSAPTSAHAASTGPLGTLALKFSAIFGHFNAYCIFSYK